MLFDEININTRFEQVIKMAWEIFQCKIGNGLITIYKEASMQLHFSNILQNLIPLFIYANNEYVEIQLEKTINYNNKSSEVDMFVIIKQGENEYNIAIEMKCYREYASLGGKRSAVDIFLKNVYVDIEKLENYKINNKCNSTILLIMNDLERIVYPPNKDSKYWAYDISDGYLLTPKTLTTPVDGDNLIIINNQYNFKWTKLGKNYFLML